MKKIITLMLSIILVFAIGITAYGATIEYTDKNGQTQRISDFRDTKGHWSHDVILKWADYNLVAGNQGYFMPNSPIKRGDLCVILDRMLGLESISYNYFYDLPNNEYYTESVLKCVAAGYVSGTSATTVDAGGKATREQVAVIIYRMFDLDSSGYKNVRKFSDDYNIGSWAKEAVYTMRKYGYMNGDGSNNFNPRANITRAEFIQVMNNIASAYVPQRDLQNMGSTFQSEFQGNLMTSRNISLVNSFVQNDFIITQSARSVELSNTTVNGRLLAMSNKSINLTNCTIGTIYLMNGKSNILGITDSIKNVYVCESASESSIDAIPYSITLEPGTRIRVEGKYYENDTNTVKKYVGSELKADLASTQGSVVGGPKITGGYFSQSYANEVTLSDLRVLTGVSDISEIGVVWKKQTKTDNQKLPTYQDNDGKAIYKYDKYDELISMDVGIINSDYIYRTYVKDKNGLFAYGNAKELSAYDFNIVMDLYEIEYPKKIGIDVTLKGNNVPPIQYVEAVYDTNGEYSTNHKRDYMTKYIDGLTETKIEDSKYIRYTFEAYSPYEIINGVAEYTPLSYFGYVIHFSDGSIINKFPVLTNKIPQNAKPVQELKAGRLILNDNRITIKDCILLTNYVQIQEVGMMYKESNMPTIDSPISDFDSWTKMIGGTAIGVNTKYVFSSQIPIENTNCYTLYCPYVRTSNGYYFGTTQYVSNDVKGDIGGYKIQEVRVEQIGETEGLFTIILNDSIKLTDNAIISLGNIGSYNLSELQAQVSDNYIYFKKGIKQNEQYTIPIIIYTSTGLKSNTYFMNFDTSKNSIFYIGNKSVSGGYYEFSVLSSSIPVDNISISNIYTVNSNIIAIKNKNNTFYISKDSNYKGVKVVVSFTYYVMHGPSGTIAFDFSQTLELN